MKIQMIGIDHSTASIDVRGKFSFTTAQSVAAMEAINAHEAVSGCVLFSTCNRTELWISYKTDEPVDLYSMLCTLKGAEPDAFRTYFRERQGEEAVVYLFELASGLRSLIVGEDQILAQVKKAPEAARSGGFCDNVLEVLFRSAVTGAKKVKSGLSLSTANASAVELAIERMRSEGIDFAGKNCLVIGNGEMGKRAANALRHLGANVTVTVRQYRSGVVEIPENCSRINYGERFEKLPDCDIILSATSSPNMTIRKEELEKYPLSSDKIFIDLAVPRDIEPSIRELEHVTLYDIDDFPVDETEELHLQTEKAKELLREQEERFISWYECRDLIPATERLAGYMAEEVDLRVGSYVKKLALTPEQNRTFTEAVDSAAANVLRKLLFAVRDNAGADVFRQCITAMETVNSEK